MNFKTSIFVIIFYLVAKFCDVQSASVMSVDLGSEWMKVGVISPGVPMEIALNKESKRKTPVYIGFKDGERVFGDEAITLSMRFPSRSFGYLTDLIGKTYDNPVVELYKKRFPYHNIEKDPERNTILFRDGNETYVVEELIAQILEKAKEFAQDYTGQQISETVIVVPGFFGQAERNCILQAAKLIDLKVLQLMNDYTAVALNYGIFRRKEINETAQYYVFYDIGAYKATAAVVSYQLVRDKVTKEVIPSLQILGVGYDRSLGGLEMQLRLRDHLAKKFNEMKKTKTDVFTNARAMAKLFKEAGRVKNILSANSEIYAQIEGVLEEHDFKVQVTRDQFESMCKDIFEKVPAVLNQALSSAELTIDSISQVILFGGSTRVPKIQEFIKKSINMELSKNLNSDEAAALGAVYRAADLTTGFKVKKFLTKDAVLFPVQVVFDREGESGTLRQVRRTLFRKMDTYPQKKVITFNKHQSDFTFNVNYAELDHLEKNEINNLGSLNLSTVQLSQVSEILEKNVAENVESKGIKAHFAFDDSGLFKLLNTEFIFEKKVAEEKDENTFQKISSTISKLFATEEDDTKDSGTQKEKEANETSKEDETQEAKLNATNATGETESIESSKTEKIKTVTVKEDIPQTVTTLHTKPLEGEKLAVSLQRVHEIQAKEFSKRRKENAMNALESFVIEAQMRLDQDEYKDCALENEIQTILKSCTDISDWIYEDGLDADAEVYETKLADLKELTNEIYSKHWEHNERPEALNALKSMINGSEGFLATAKNLTKETNPVKDVFTQGEIDNLQKAINETIKWRDTEVEEQNKLALNEPVRLTVKSITDKMSYLDREVKYLVNKIKLWRPKVPPVKEETNKNDTSSEESSTNSTNPSEENIVNEEPKVTEEKEVPSEDQTVAEEIDVGEEKDTKDNEVDTHEEL